MKRESFNFKMWAALCALCLSLGFSSERRTMESPDGNLIASVTNNEEGVSNDYEQPSVIPGELRTPDYRTIQLEGIGYDPGLNRQDPSNVIKVPKELINPNKRSVKTTGLPDNPDEENHDPSNIIRFNGAYYLWYTGYPPGKGGPTNARIKLAVSKDGYHWDIRGTALENNTPGHWDAGGVMTAYVVPTQGKYYMFYSGVCPKYTQEQHRLYPKSIGIAVADTPDGPWKRYSGNPILQPEEHTWEGLICDDANVFYKDNKWWLYYKGLPKNGKPGETKIGIAFAQNITGPYEKYKGNPIMHGHAFTAWIHRNGVAFIGGNYGAQNVFWSEDGIHFIKAGGFQNRSTGLYCPENFGNGENPNGVWWGLGVGMDRRYIYRFECDLKVED